MKQQIFIDNVHEYDYELVDDRLHTLYYNGCQWSSIVRRKVAMQIKDNGNGLLVDFKDKNVIDYSEAEQLFILLKLINSPAKYEIATKTLL